jgi:hypothetical protein
MPIAPAAPPPPPSAPAAPHLVPQAQRVTPVEPAKRVTKSERGGRAELDKDRRRRKRDDPRGGLFDVEV